MKPWEEYAIAETEPEEKSTAPWIKYQDEEAGEDTPSKPGAPTGKKDRNIFSLPDDAEKAVFPTSGVQATGERKNILKEPIGTLKQSAGAAFDLLGAPTRALGKVRGYEMSDPESALLRPEINKAKKFIDEKGTGILRKVPYLGMTTGIAPIDEKLDAGRKEVAKFIVDATGTTFSDPLVLGSLLKNSVAKPLKNVATKIESSILGKGNKSLLDKQGLTAKQAAETTLEKNLGGSLKGTVKKIDKKAGKLDDAIDKIIADYEKANPTARMQPDDAVLRVGDRITRPGSDPLVFGKTPEAAKAWDFWSDEMGRHNKLGSKKLSEFQNVKRDLGQVGFKGGALNPDIEAKEMVSDLINLEMRDDIAGAVPDIKKYNEEFKKILPIKKLAQNRLPVSESNNILGLGTLLLGAGKLTPDQIAKIAAYELSKSGVAAQGMYNLGKGLQKLPNAYGLAAISNLVNTSRRKKD